MSNQAALNKEQIDTTNLQVEETNTKVSQNKTDIENLNVLAEENKTKLEGLATDISGDLSEIEKQLPQIQCPLKTWTLSIRIPSKALKT